LSMVFPSPQLQFEVSHIHFLPNIITPNNQNLLGTQSVIKSPACVLAQPSITLQVNSGFIVPEPFMHNVGDGVDLARLNGGIQGGGNDAGEKRGLGASLTLGSVLAMEARMPLSPAAAALGISLSELRRACRRLGVPRWRHRAHAAAAAAAASPTARTVAYAANLRRRYGGQQLPPQPGDQEALAPFPPGARVEADARLREPLSWAEVGPGSSAAGDAAATEAADCSAAAGAETGLRWPP
jgi:hypothetical protein